MTGLCRDCLSEATHAPCPACGSTRVVVHPDLHRLAIAHIDCDAFFAAVEKRDNPSLADAPVIIGGGQRGVVATACYVARQYGVRSAMPMFKALAACPQAVVIKPRMAAYKDASRQIRALMEETTPLVEPVSIDEAYLDLSGTQRLHGRAPAATLMALQARIKAEVGVTVSVGLAANKFLAKLAVDFDKPNGFTAIGPSDAQTVLDALAPQAVPGVGPRFAAKLAADGLTTLRAVRALEETDLMRRYGEAGLALSRRARGLDARKVETGGERKSISAERTFDVDIRDPAALEDRLWEVCERTAARAKQLGLAGASVTLKLKTARFSSRTRARAVNPPAQYAHRLFEVARELLAKEADGTAFRLIGVGISKLTPSLGDPGELFDHARAKRTAAEAAMDAARAKFGDAAVVTGRALRAQRRPRPNRR